MTFPASPERVWRHLLFYEQIEGRPPLALRLALPVPTRTEGRKTQVGDEAKCIYRGGHLIKRVTEVEVGRHYRFEVVEQALDVGNGIRLLGGGYTFRRIADGGTEVTLATRYRSARRPRCLWKRIEVAVCHLMHRYILAAMHRAY